jgi:hypothetical protein
VRAAAHERSFGRKGDANKPTNTRADRTGPDRRGNFQDPLYYLDPHYAPKVGAFTAIVTQLLSKARWPIRTAAALGTESTRHA